MALDEEFITNNKAYSEVEERVDSIKFSKIDKTLLSKLVPEIASLSNWSNSSYFIIESDKGYFHIFRMDNESVKKLYIFINYFELNKSPKKRVYDMNITGTSQHMSDIDLNANIINNKPDNIPIDSNIVNKNIKITNNPHHISSGKNLETGKIKLSSPGTKNPFTDNYLKLDALDINEYLHYTHQYLKHLILNSYL